MEIQKEKSTESDLLAENTEDNKHKMYHLFKDRFKKVIYRQNQ